MVQKNHLHPTFTPKWFYRLDVLVQKHPNNREKKKLTHISKGSLTYTFNSLFPSFTFYSERERAPNKIQFEPVIAPYPK